MFHRSGRTALRLAKIAEPLLMDAVRPGRTRPAGRERAKATVFSTAMMPKFWSLADKSRVIGRELFVRSLLRVGDQPSECVNSTALIEVNDH